MGSGAISSIATRTVGTSVERPRRHTLLKLIEDIEMNTTEQLQTNFYTIGVKFPGDGYAGHDAYRGKIYTYKVPNDVTFAVDDFAVVRVEGKEPELKVVKVVEVNNGNTCEQDAPFKYKWVVQKVELDMYQQRLDNDKLLTAMVAELKNRKLRQSVFDELSSVATPEEMQKIKNLSGFI